ncbi:hypothetical protein ACFLTE_05340 [Bacteroidota bacterium]
MKILPVEKEKKGLQSDNFKLFLKAEAEHVWELYENGIIREIYFNQDHNALLIIEVNSLKK